MAKKYEFQPDRPYGTWLSKLHLTKLQQQQVLKWFFYALVLLALSVLQDVVLCRMQLFGATTDLVPLAIFLICVQIGADRGAIFCLVAAMLYKFSGTAPGYYSMALIPVLALLAAKILLELFGIM
jgi:hypothetical protein